MSSTTNPTSNTTKKGNTAVKAKQESTNQPTTKKEKGTTVKTKAEVQAPSTHPLAHLIPDKEFWLDTYVGRTVHGVQDLTVFATAHKRRENILLFGPTGSAKTTVTYTYAASVGLPVVNVPCNGAIDPDGLFGGPAKDGDGWKFAPGDLTLAVQHGGIILVNEANFAPPKILAVLYGLLDRRRTLTLPEAAGWDFPTSIKAHPDCIIVADYNPDYIGTRPLSEAFINRFAHKLPWGYERAVEDELIGCTPLQDIADQIRTRHESGDLSSTVPTNLLLEFLDNVYEDALGYDYAVSNFVASFPPDERQVVKEIFNINEHALTAEFGLVEETATEEEVGA